MKLQCHQQFTFFGVLVVISQSGLADSTLGIVADAPEVAIAARPANASFLRLPALTYSFSIEAFCADQLQATSLLISVADTRKSLGGDQINASGATEISLRIPAQQIAPIAIRGFCELAKDDEAEELPDTQRQIIPSVLSAQASMRCAAANDVPDTNNANGETQAEKTLYASTAMDVTLICERRDAVLNNPNR